MKVILTFDIEVWCDGWNHLDASFPEAFERYSWGSSKAGSYALPKTLEVLKKNNLHGVFFVEPLFAARFGVKYLQQIVSFILGAGMEVQLHLHPEWTDEITPSLISNSSTKRQHLSFYTLEEQISLIKKSIDLLQEAGAPRPTVFRAGNFSANGDTFRALFANHIFNDSSVNATVENSVTDLRDDVNLYQTQKIHGVRSYPMSIFIDGVGKLRHAQIGACSSSEMIQAMMGARKLGWPYFIFLSHNVEMLRRESSYPDWIVVKRFERLCEFLGKNAAQFPTRGFLTDPDEWSHGSLDLPRVNFISTVHRISEQIVRRLV